mmetsp:Transcript_79115/g.207712  ORF Transcript_79115/g.207712 Transcript_79115/m.207712 type:complete len:594 (-) Transcript_79115:866-2647(-)
MLGELLILLQVLLLLGPHHLPVDQVPQREGEEERQEQEHVPVRRRPGAGEELGADRPLAPGRAHHGQGEAPEDVHVDVDPVRRVEGSLAKAEVHVLQEAVVEDRPAQLREKQLVSVGRHGEEREGADEGDQDEVRVVADLDLHRLQALLRPPVGVLVHVVRGPREEHPDHLQERLRQRGPGVDELHQEGVEEEGPDAGHDDGHQEADEEEARHQHPVYVLRYQGLGAGGVHRRRAHEHLEPLLVVGRAEHGEHRDEDVQHVVDDVQEGVPEQHERVHGLLPAEAHAEGGHPQLDADDHVQVADDDAQNAHAHPAGVGADAAVGPQEVLHERVDDESLHGCNHGEDLGQAQDDVPVPLGRGNAHVPPIDAGRLCLDHAKLQGLLGLGVRQSLSACGVLAQHLALVLRVLEDNERLSDRLQPLLLVPLEPRRDALAVLPLAPLQLLFPAEVVLRHFPEPAVASVARDTGLRGRLQLDPHLEPLYLVLHLAPPLRVVVAEADALHLYLRGLHLAHRVLQVASAVDHLAWPRELVGQDIPELVLEPLPQIRLVGLAGGQTAHAEAVVRHHCVRAHEPSGLPLLIARVQEEADEEGHV